MYDTQTNWCKLNIILYVDMFILYNTCMYPLLQKCTILLTFKVHLQFQQYNRAIFTRPEKKLITSNSTVIGNERLSSEISIENLHIRYTRY